jgi:hypothetical protein
MAEWQFIGPNPENQLYSARLQDGRGFSTNPLCEFGEVRYLLLIAIFPSDNAHSRTARFSDASPPEIMYQRNIKYKQSAVEL